MLEIEIPKKLKIKVESTSHHPPDVKKIAETEAGSIYRIPIPLNFSNHFQSPEYIENLTSTPRKRKLLSTTLHWNSRIGPRDLGRPNSGFVVLREKTLFIDHLHENRDHVREETSKLHDCLREKFSYTRDCTIASGHLCPINFSTKNARYIMALDGYSGEGVYWKMNPKEQLIVSSLYASRIVPMTSDGFIIK